MVKDLTYKSCMSLSIPGYYFNDYSHPDMEKRYEEFNLQKAFELCLNLRNTINGWENNRLQRMNSK